MNRHWVKLEYPEILARLAKYADFSGGEALILALTPTPDVHEARERLSLTGEARKLLEDRASFGLGGVRDVRPLVERTEHGVMLQPSEFLEIRDTLRGGANVHRVLTRLAGQFPGLADIAWRVQPIPELVEAISQVLDDRGEVRDNASPELSRIRRELRSTQERVQTRLRNLIGSPHMAPYLQETLVTRREGRFVIPIRAEHRNRVQGIVHDRSSSGVTYFMEPMEVVEMNNALRELAIAEEEEIARLLQALSAQTARSADVIVASIEALCELDLTLAKARYAGELSATEPELVAIPQKLPEPEGENLHAGTVLRLPGARHPLLDPEQVVPVDVVLDDETHLLIITGPNTGGKTVSLKTVGLLTLMAQAGMHIPTDSGAKLSCFEMVCADIGDEQSIEQSLSTFSSHLTNIISFLQRIDHRALVLLDELGAGTDPAEGAALARSLLEAFRTRRCTTFVATHYPELKLYAHNTPGVRNASMEFDVETLAPTYHLVIGLPGRSNAFAIAWRLGMPERIVKRAQGMISGEELRAEDMLTDLHNLRIEVVASRDEARRARREAQGLALDLRKRLENIEQERAHVLRRAEEEAHQELEELREEVRAMRRRLRNAPLRQSQDLLEEVEELEDEVDKLGAGTARPEPLVAAVPIPQVEPEPEEEGPSGPIREGDTVRVVGLNMQGTVTEIEDDEAMIQAGALRTRVSLDDLELLYHERKRKAQQVHVPPPPPSPGIQIDLRGQTVEESLVNLDRYLDSATMATLPWVRIVHGKGTGRLRQEIRRFLSDHPLVSSYERAGEKEGGDGATIVRLVGAR